MAVGGAHARERVCGEGAGKAKGLGASKEAVAGGEGGVERYVTGDGTGGCEGARKDCEKDGEKQKK